MRIFRLIALILAASGQAALAQIPPGGGGQFQQIPPSPLQQREDPGIRIDQGGRPATPDLKDDSRISVRALRVTGQTLYPESRLIEVAGFSPGEMSLGDLRAMATRIGAHYRSNGYIVAQAYLPAQAIADGVVTIAVIEGRYGDITLRNQSTLSEPLARELLEGLNPGDPIAIAPLETRLLLLSDLPGVAVKSTLSPGASVGASDLLVEVNPGQRVTGSLEADNAGNRYTGEFRVGGTINLNNPTGHGDVASLRVLTSGDGLKYGRASYQTQFGRTTVGAAYTALDYRLGREFENLRAHGTARIASLYGSHPLIRSRNTNLYALLHFDHKTFEDRVDSVPSITERRVKVLMPSLAGNHRDRIGGGGLNRFSLTWSAGDVDIRTPAALAVDAATARTHGRYHKLGFTASRLQRVTDTVSLSAAIQGQVASKNLDISEKMVLGGLYGVRAYPAGEAYADEGYILNLEARYLLPKPPNDFPGRVHLIGFVDTGRVAINAEPWVAGRNHRTLSGAGLGLSWAEYGNFVVNTYWARKIGNEPAVSAPDKSSRVWIQGIKFF